MHDACDLNVGHAWEIFVVLDTPLSMDDGIKIVNDGDPDKDLVIGIANFANNSSGTRDESCGMLLISSIRDWVEDIIDLEVIPPHNVSNLISSHRGI